MSLQEIAINDNIIYTENNNNYYWLAKIIEIGENYVKIKFDNESFYSDFLYPQGLPTMVVWNRENLHNINEFLYRQYILK
jgi:hypothetical protein